MRLNLLLYLLVTGHLPTITLVLTAYDILKNSVVFSVFDVWTWYSVWHSWQVTWKILASPTRLSCVTCRSETEVLHDLHDNSLASKDNLISRRPIRFTFSLAMEENNWILTMTHPAHPSADRVIEKVMLRTEWKIKKNVILYIYLALGLHSNVFS